MVDFERARAHMVESQLRAGGVTNAPILAQMRSVPRELFVAANRRDVAYIDDIQWLGERSSGRFMAAPATLARLLRLAEITERDAVLDFGAGTGYGTAVMAGLAATVVGIEPDAALAAEANANLARLGIGNASVTAGSVEKIGHGQFDVIIVQGALDTVPEVFTAALADGGRLVALIRTRAVCVAHILVKSAGKVTTRAEFNAFLPPLNIERPNEEFVF